ncbi:hypothetical protein [Microbacterium kribbense]|uniref:hypothetical protein n=1 Tax=Microbacterium kribbense TaxID=433645 RepID=UPI0031DC3CE0
MTGPTTSVPTVDVRTPFHTTTTQFADVNVGDGKIPITSDSQMVVLDVTLVSAGTGKKLVSTQYSGDLSQVVSLSRWAQQFPAFTDALHCATAGSRVAVAMAPGAIDPASAQGLGMSKDDSLIAVVEVRKVYLGAADGTPAYTSGWGLPAVVRAPGGRPGIIVRDGAAPQHLSVHVLERGAFQKVTGDQPVLVNYTIVNWTDKTVASTTWDGEPKFITLSSESKGMQAAIKGQTVGSQVMAIIPKTDGTSGVKDTQVAVIDILGVGPAPATAAQ